MFNYVISVSVGALYSNYVGLYATVGNYQEYMNELITACKFKIHNIQIF